MIPFSSEVCLVTTYTSWSWACDGSRIFRSEPTAVGSAAAISASVVAVAWGSK